MTPYIENNVTPAMGKVCKEAKASRQDSAVWSKL
jgi:hypothetical protein